MAFATRTVLSLDEAAYDEVVRPLDYPITEQPGEYAAMRRHVRAHGINLPWSVASRMPAHKLSSALKIWADAPEGTRRDEIEKSQLEDQRRDDKRRREDAASTKRRALEGLVLTGDYLPAAELCNRFSIKPGTLRQWANRGHVRTDTQTLRMARGGFAKTGNEWEEAQGLRDVKVYHVGDTIDRARQSGMSLGEQHAPDAHNALRMLHHAYRECVRLNVPAEVLSKHLLNLAQGDDSAFPALETDKDMGLA